MDKATIEKYKKAGKIARECKKLAKSLVKEGASYLEIAEKIEGKIVKLGGGIAFPVDVSVNEVAAHYSPFHQDKNVLKKGDLVKVDLGVHVDGYVADTEISLSVGKSKENEDLIKAAEEALNAGIKIVKPGVKVSEIGRVIDEAIEKRGFRSIKNLSGHLVDNWVVHAGLTIPNYNTKSDIVLEEGMVIAIEPFATTGSGWVVDSKNSEIYELVAEGNVRQNREILNHIIDNHQTLPFSKRQLVKKFGLLKASFAIRELLQKEIIKEFKVLKERAGGKVSQAEHTILVLDKPVVIT